MSTTDGHKTKAAPVRRAAARRSKPPPFPIALFGRSLAMLLLLAREAVMQRWRPFLHARGLTDQQWRVMRALREVDSLEIIELGKRCCIHPASLSRILPKLAAEGIVSRCSNAADHRRVIVSLAPAGRRLVEESLAEGARIHAEIARDIGPERLDHLYEHLEEVLDLLAAAKPNGGTHAAPDIDRASRRLRPGQRATTGRASRTGSRTGTRAKGDPSSNQDFGAG
jgi:homoprotocatechuate degradation regulator HpaR